MEAEMKSIRIPHKRRRTIFLLLIFEVYLFMLLLHPFSVQAAENGSTGRRQIVFVLDGSYSMTEKRWQTAVDCIAMVEAMLPSDYEAALLVYNSEVVYRMDFGQVTERRLGEIQNLERKGYTNTGEAVAAALEAFSTDELAEKRILIISDGEISMKGQTETEEALQFYEEAVGEAVAQNVKIDILLFDDTEIERQIIGASELTGGYLFEEAGTETVETNRPLTDTSGQFVRRFAESYLFEQLGIKRVVQGASDAMENAVDIALRDSCAEQVRILVTAETAIEDMQVSCQSRDVRITRGKQFAVIELEQPMEKIVKLQYTLIEPGRVNICLTKEYDITVGMEAVYVQELSMHQIRIQMCNMEGENLLREEDSSQEPEIYMDGSKVSYTLEQGEAVVSYPIETSREVSVRVDFENMEGMVKCSGGEGSLFLELPPSEPPEEKESYLWVYVVVSGVCVIFVILLILFHSTKKKRPRPQRPYKRHRAS